MVNLEHLAILKQGVEVWNAWREDNLPVRPDLREANLREANLRRANLSRANLSRADLSGANLSGANLSGANLFGANLNGADLYGVNLSEAVFSKADFSRANLRGSYLRKAYLRKANLRGVDLRGADLYEANLYEANLTGANLRGADLERTNLKGAILNCANLESVSLRRSDMIDSDIDGAVITGAKLWESKRSGWSIKGVTCEYAYTDREGKEKIEFKPGEFEKLYSEQTKIVLHYADGLTPFEVSTLPALIQFIESKHHGVSLRLRTIGEDAGGASVTVAVNELGDADLSVLKEDFESYKERIREELKRDTEIKMEVLKGQVNLLTDLIDRKMGDTLNINKLIGVGKSNSSTVSQSIHTNDIDGITKLISEILAARSEIEKVLPPEKAEELNVAIEMIQAQAVDSQTDREKLKKGVQSFKKLLDGLGDAAGKWMPIVEKLSNLL